MLELLVADVGPWFCNFSSLRGGIRPLALPAQDNNPPSDQSQSTNESSALDTGRLRESVHRLVTPEEIAQSKSTVNQTAGKTPDEVLL
jgi:hypothetical protein